LPERQVAGKASCLQFAKKAICRKGKLPERQVAGKANCQEGKLPEGQLAVIGYVQVDSIILS
jgi:hypothetical protein